MKAMAFLAGTMLAMMVGSASAQETAGEMAAKFGALETIQDISLSPNGTKAAFLSPLIGGGRALYVIDLVAGGDPRPISRATNDGETLQWCSFATDTRLVCQVSATVDGVGQLVNFSRLLAMNSDGSDVKFVNTGQTFRSLGFVQNGGQIIHWNVPGKPGHVLVTRDYVSEVSVGTRLAESREGLGVSELDLATLSSRAVEQPKRGAVRYLSDEDGNVRVMATRSQAPNGYDRLGISYFYRKIGSRKWETLARNSEREDASEEFWPIAVDSEKDVVYGFADHSGRQALFSVSLDGEARRKLLVSRPDVDIDSLIRIGRNRRVVGASYATERRTIEFFDPELKELGLALQQALPGQPSIDFVDASADEGRLLLLASSDVDPGKFYLYDKVGRRLEEVLPVRAELTGVEMAVMRPITYPAADGTSVPAYLTLPPGSSGKGLPAIVMPHGGPGARDEWGFDWLVQYFALRGFAVIQPNYRGSSGYGSDWYQKNGFQSWRTAIGDVNDAARHLIAAGIAAEGKLAILGWSYGGYAALQSSALDADLFQAIVAVAPVTDLERLRQESSGYTSYRRVDEFIGRGPHVREGSPALNARMIKAPVLLFHGDRDDNVGVGQSRLMAERLKDAGKKVTYIEFAGLDHQLPSAEARTRLLADSDRFLRDVLQVETP